MPYFLTDHLWYPDASGSCGTAPVCLPHCLQMHQQCSNLLSPQQGTHVALALDGTRCDVLWCKPGKAGPLLFCGASPSAQAQCGTNSSLQQLCPAPQGSQSCHHAPALASLLQTARCTPTGRPPAACLVGTRTLCTQKATTPTCPCSPTVPLRWEGCCWRDCLDASSTTPVWWHQSSSFPC